MSLSDIFPDVLHSSLNADAPSSMRLITRQGESFQALASPLGGGSMCISMWPGPSARDHAAPARQDDLTGLALRNPFMAALEAAVGEIEPLHVAVLCLDLDRFKMINDTLGHGIGDQLLKKVADRLRAACRKEDVIARLGGDEFVILQKGISGAQDAEKLAGRLVDLVGRTYVLSGHTINVGVSIGVAIVRGAIQPRDLLRNADLALYEAKRAGRGRYRFFESGMDAELRERRELEDRRLDLARMVTAGRLLIAYRSRRVRRTYFSLMAPDSKAAV